MTNYTELIKALREEACNPFSHIEDARLMCRAADAIEELTKCLEGVCADNDNLTQKLIELNQKYIDALNEMQRQMCRADGGKWISVKERLPDDWNQKVVFHRGGVSFAYYNGSMWCSSIGKFHYLCTVTHWMPMPEPPKEET